MAALFLLTPAVLIPSMLLLARFERGLTEAPRAVPVAAPITKED